MSQPIKLLDVVVESGKIVIRRASGGPIKYRLDEAPRYLEIWRTGPEHLRLKPEFLDKFEAAIKRLKNQEDAKL